MDGRMLLTVGGTKGRSKTSARERTSATVTDDRYNTYEMRCLLQSSVIISIYKLIDSNERKGRSIALRSVIRRAAASPALLSTHIHFSM